MTTSSIRKIDNNSSSNRQHIPILVTFNHYSLRGMAWDKASTCYFFQNSIVFFNNFTAFSVCVVSIDFISVSCLFKQLIECHESHCQRYTDSLYNCYSFIWCKLSYWKLLLILFFDQFLSVVSLYFYVNGMICSFRQLLTLAYLTRWYHLSAFWIIEILSFFFFWQLLKLLFILWCQFSLAELKLSTRILDY